MNTKQNSAHSYTEGSDIETYESLTKPKEEEVSEDVKRAAREHGQKVLETTGDPFRAISAHDAFIAGALYSKPFEHEAKPKDDDTRH